MPIVVGETVGAYRIIEQLGQGGMATVFKAYHASLDRYVAIKALHPAFKEDPNFLARFQREARVVAKLDHPNIVPIYDFSEHEGRPYLVMKFIEGETLKARLVRRHLSIPEIKEIVDAVGAALTYAHRQGILHRDVKPSNVLLAKDGQIYLADFGLARIATAGESTISSDMMLGTPQYISPEQAMGKRELDEGTDIYSFGVLLYELMVGQVPFSADTPYAIIHDHIYSPLPLPRSLNPKVSEDIERVLLKALAKERADRYPTVLALVEAFKNAIGGMEASPLEGKAEDTQATTVHPVVTEVTIPPSPEPVAPLDEPPSVEIIKKEEQIPTKAEIPSEKLTLAKEPLFKKWYAWLFMIAIVFCICLGVWLGLRMVRNSRTRSKQVVPTDTQAQQGASIPLDAFNAARSRVDKNPNEPIAHLDLAVILIDARQFDEVQPELNKVDELAKESGFYIDNGRKFVAQQKWIAAAWTFQRVMELTPDPKPVDLFNLWHESVYKAFNDPEAGRVIDMDRIRLEDPAIAGVARAQAELAAGNVGQAEVDIMDTLKQYNNFTEALLVQARVLAKKNLHDRAGKILDGLNQNGNLPPWIRVEIARIQEVENP